MAKGTRIPMPTDAQLLTLAQWFSPGYPVGAFSYSHGLEWAMTADAVSTAAELKDWIATVLRDGSGWSDALFLTAAYHAPNTDAVTQIDAQCRAYAPSLERLRETDLQGAAFCQITRSVWLKTDQNGIPAKLTYPVAVGFAAICCSMPLQATIALYLQAFAANLVAAGQRLAPIGQSEAQACLHALAPLCQDIAEQTNEGDLGQLSSTSFLVDIAAMKHETQHSRIFRT
ncbi:urease accessory protein UreF [Phaeobacter inhibens]|nr:urease accessory protein UreF [Phaeobacter inhibens]AUQ80007.1 urease accessory protein UreF [Phaeobacter inhibens]AUR17166.1 urease accessory protein UreF [Phaeobacter inhibens]